MNSFQFILLPFLTSCCKYGVSVTYEGQSREEQAETSSIIPILSYESYPPDGGFYSYQFKTENGISVQERGFPKFKEGSRVAGGTYSYTAPNGDMIVVTWLADEDGFRSKQCIIAKENNGRKCNPKQLVHGPFSVETSSKGKGTRIKSWYVDENEVRFEEYHILAHFRPIG